MDNLAHSLAGVVLARIAEERLYRSFPQIADSSIGKRLPFLFGLTGILASNLPDFDLIYTWITPGQLGYLLHHRGHTHTLVALPLLALFWLGVLRISVLRHQPLRQFPQLWRSLSLLTMSALLFHLLMDFPNNYGIHPFWPFYNGWFHGDFMFIVEPWLWLVLLGTVGGMARHILTRTFCVVAMCGVVILAYKSKAVPNYLQMVMLAWIPAYMAVQLLWLKKLHYKLGLGLGLLVAVYSAFAVGSTLAKSHYEILDIAEIAKGTSHSVERFDTVLTPQPGNPLCWNFTGMGLLGADLQAQDATSWYVHKGLIPLQNEHLCSVDQNHTATEWVERPLQPLLEQYRQNCHVRAFFQFARVPLWSLHGSERGEGALRHEVWRWSDQRYSSDKGVGFSDIFITNGTLGHTQEDSQNIASYHGMECPPWMTHWTPPRHDLLQRLNIVN